MRSGTLRSAAVASVVVVTGGLAVVLVAGREAPTPPARLPGPVARGVAPERSGLAPDDPETRRATRLLRAWDRRRARAYATGDARALRRLYVAGSGARVRDVRLLQGYTGRGLVVTGMRMALLRVDVLRTRPGRLVLGVTDRLAEATAVWSIDPQVRRRLPTDRPSAHVVTLRRRDGSWLVARVSSVDGVTAAPRPPGP